MISRVTTFSSRRALESHFRSFAYEVNGISKGEDKHPSHKNDTHDNSAELHIGCVVFNLIGDHSGVGQVGFSEVNVKLIGPLGVWQLPHRQTDACQYCPEKPSHIDHFAYFWKHNVHISFFGSAKG